MINHRPATDAEVLAAVKPGRKVSFRHFLLELPAPHARNGVMHRERSTATVRLVDGWPHVRHHGKLEPLTCTIATLECGREIPYDFRIKSPYLT